MSTIASSYINSNLSGRVFSFQKVDKNNSVSLDSLPVVDWISRNNIPFKKPITAQRDSTYQEIHLGLPAELDDYYPLLRAVLASGKHRFFSISTDEALKSFILKYEAAQEAEVKTYLSQVFNIIREEARFKKVLRNVIVNQRKYQREESLLFSELSKS